MSPEGCGRKLRPRVVSRNHEIGDAEANGGQAQAQRDRSGEDGCPDETHDPVRTTRRCKCIAGGLDGARSGAPSASGSVFVHLLPTVRSLGGRKDRREGRKLLKVCTRTPEPRLTGIEGQGPKLFSGPECIGTSGVEQARSRLNKVTLH